MKRSKLEQLISDNPAMIEWVETGILNGWIDVDRGIHFLSPALEPKFRVTD